MTEAETLSEVPTAVPSMRAHLAKASTPCTFTTRAEPPAIISTARPVRPFLGAERSLFVGHHGNLVPDERQRCLAGRSLKSVSPETVTVRVPLGEDRLRLGQVVRGPHDEQTVVQRHLDEVHHELTIVEH